MAAASIPPPTSGTTQDDILRELFKYGEIKTAKGRYFVTHIKTPFEKFIITPNPGESVSFQFTTKSGELRKTISATKITVSITPNFQVFPISRFISYETKSS